MGTELTLANTHLHKKGVVKGDGGCQTVTLETLLLLSSNIRSCSCSCWCGSASDWRRATRSLCTYVCSDKLRPHHSLPPCVSTRSRHTVKVEPPSYIRIYMRMSHVPAVGSQPL